MAIKIDRIGHCLLRVRDLEESEKFYQMLGFQTVEKDPKHGDEIFMAGPNDGHTLDLQPCDDPSSAHVPEGGNWVGVQHIAFKVASWEDLKDAIATLKKNGVPIRWMTDHNNQRSIYFDDPSGNHLEIYWEYPTAKYLFAYGRGDKDRDFSIDYPVDPWVTWEGALADPGAWQR